VRPYVTRNALYGAKMYHKTGFRTSGLKHLPLKEVLDGIVQAGFQTVEFCLEHPEASSSTLEFARESGLEISSVSYHGKRDDPFTRLDMGRRVVRMAEECSVSHTRTVPSLEPVAIRLLSGLNTAELTQPSCP